MRTDFTVLTKVRSTAQAILNMFQLQPTLLHMSDEAVLLNQHAYNIALQNPFAVLKEIKPSGATVWEDGVGSDMIMEVEVDDAAAN